MEFKSTSKRESFDGIEAVKPRKTGNNTFEYWNSEGDRIVRFHLTDIITFKASGDIVLTSGGYRTKTTKDRFNEFLPDNEIYQAKGSWFISTNETENRASVPFFDGIVLKKGKLPKPNNKIIKQTAEMTKRINSFVNILDSMEEIPQPDNGDCWYCLMKTEDGASLGEAVKDTDHLDSHLSEGYLHGSLLVNAMRFVGYQDHQIGIHYHMRLKDTFKRALRRYLKAKLLPA